jgi:hypothetical protein
MTHYPDLATRCMVDWGPRTRAIGWLSVREMYPRGPVAPAFLEALARQLGGPQLLVFMGPHLCDLCPPPHGNGGSMNVWIPTEACVYVAPELVLHYIRDHHYRPPDEFVEAVLTAPPQGSPRFWELLHRSSGFLARQRELEHRMHQDAKRKRGQCATCGSIGVLDDADRCYDCAPGAAEFPDEVTGDLQLHDPDER